MTIIYGPGKRARHGFVPIGFMEDYRGGCYWIFNDFSLGASKRSVSLRTIRRLLGKAPLPDCDRITIPNWRVGYADLVVTLK